MPEIGFTKNCKTWITLRASKVLAKKKGRKRNFQHNVEVQQCYFEFCQTVDIDALISNEQCSKKKRERIKSLKNREE